MTSTKNSAVGRGRGYQEIVPERPGVAHSYLSTLDNSDNRWNMQSVGKAVIVNSECAAFSAICAPGGIFIL